MPERVAVISATSSLDLEGRSVGSADPDHVAQARASAQLLLQQTTASVTARIVERGIIPATAVWSVVNESPSASAPASEGRANAGGVRGEAIPAEAGTTSAATKDVQDARGKSMPVDFGSLLDAAGDTAADGAGAVGGTTATSASMPPPATAGRSDVQNVENSSPNSSAVGQAGASLLSKQDTVPDVEGISADVIGGVISEEVVREPEKKRGPGLRFADDHEDPTTTTKSLPPKSSSSPSSPKTQTGHQQGAAASPVVTKSVPPGSAKSPVKSPAKSQTSPKPKASSLKQPKTTSSPPQGADTPSSAADHLRQQLLSNPSAGDTPAEDDEDEDNPDVAKTTDFMKGDKKRPTGSKRTESAIWRQEMAQQGKDAFYMAKAADFARSIHFIDGMGDFYTDKGREIFTRKSVGRSLSTGDFYTEKGRRSLSTGDFYTEKGRRSLSTGWEIFTRRRVGTYIFCGRHHLGRFCGRDHFFFNHTKNHRYLSRRR